MIRNLDRWIVSLNVRRQCIALAFCLMLVGTAFGAGLGASVDAPTWAPVHSERGGWVEIDNRTDHKVRIHYQSGDGGYSQELGRLAKGHSETYPVRDCDQDLHLRAIGRRSRQWETELHVHCGKTAHWQIGGRNNDGHPGT